MFRTGYVLGITRGHNGSVCLLYNGDIVFHIEEERFTRMKYDSAPFAGIKKVLDYTPKVDYVVIAHTQPLDMLKGAIDYTGEDPYTSVLRKLGLIGNEPDVEKLDGTRGHPQVIDVSDVHHKLHAAAAFYRSGFDHATAVIIDGAGTFKTMESAAFNTGGQPTTLMTYETESIIDCKYPAFFRNVGKHHGVRDPIMSMAMNATMPTNQYVDEEENETYLQIVSDRAGIVKCYEAITNYCGFSEIEAGKTMGLAPYGKKVEDNPWFIPELDGGVYISNRNVFAPSYPNSSFFNQQFTPEFAELPEEEMTQKDFAKLDSRKNAAWKIQEESQKAAAWWIRKAYEITGNKNIVVSGGYGLNCVANYYYLEELKDLDLNIYVEPISSDAGTCIGAAMMFYKHTAQCDKKVPSSRLYLGPKHDISVDDITEAYQHDPSVVIQENVTYEDVIDLITKKNIVAVFQGRSESGPRALGNRSLIFDPRFEDGKDYVNEIKRREWFRPFAGSILLEDAHDWFDLRGMKDSPDMMYAVDCKEGIAEKIPSIIHVDGTCRIQTVTEEDNYHYYHLIKTFKEKEGCPIVFNTSFNLGGDPLVETLDDAVKTLQKSMLEHLYLPELGIMLKVENFDTDIIDPNTMEEQSDKHNFALPLATQTLYSKTSTKD